MKKSRKRAVALIVALMMGLCAVAGCGKNSAKNDTKTDSTTGETSSENGEKVYKLGISPYPAFYTWYICQAEDFFEKNGVNVELVYFPVYSDSVQAFNTGQVDMLAVAMPDVIAPYINDIGLETVLILDNSNGADGLVGGKGIEKIEDLKGKSVATEYGTIEHFFLLTALDSVGLTEDDIDFVNLSISDSAPAFLADTVDAASLWEPSLSMALEKEDSTLLVSSADIPGLIPDVLVANKDMVDNGKEDIEKVINAYFDALEFYSENEDQAIKDMAEGAEISEEEMRVSMSGSRLFSLQECIDTMENEAEDYSYIPYTTEKIAEFLKSVNMIDSVPDDTTKMFNSTYLKNVLETRESKPAPDTSLDK